MADNLAFVSRKLTQTPLIFDYSNIGTAAGTTVLSYEPAYIHAIQITQRPASGTVVVYDSAGTSGTVVATYITGTQTNSDPPPPILLDVRTKNGLAVENTANVGAVVSFGK